MIGPKHTFESVVRELREGLKKGTIVLEHAEGLQPEQQQTVRLNFEVLLNDAPGAVPGFPRAVPAFLEEPEERALPAAEKRARLKLLRNHRRHLDAQIERLENELLEGK